jgi:hypothetical protein
VPEAKVGVTKALPLLMEIVEVRVVYQLIFPALLALKLACCPLQMVAPGMLILLVATETNMGCMVVV